MTFVMTLLLATVARAKVNECANLLKGDRDRLARGIAHALATNERTGRDEVFVRLDLDILNWASDQLKRLSIGQRANVFRILEKSRLGSRYDDGGLPDAQRLVGEHGCLDVTDKSVRLVLDAFETQSEASRYTLRHELTHLFRIVEAGPFRRTAAKAAWLFEKRKLGLYREEAYAFRDDYRYLRRNYAATDLPRLAAQVVNLEDLVNEATARGILRAGAEDDPQVDARKISGLEDLTLLFQVLNGAADVRLYRIIEHALRSTEAQFIKDNLKRYAPGFTKP